VPANPAGRPRLRALRIAAGYSQPKLAEKLCFLGWVQGEGEVGVNGDMVSKWERGVTGICPMYRRLLCHLFGVTSDQLNLDGEPTDPAPDPAVPLRDPESLVAMVEQATAILDQLGSPATVLGPQLLAAHHRHAGHGPLDVLDQTAGPAAHARTATATPKELEQLTDRYQALYETANPAALLTSLAAHVQLVTGMLGADHSPAVRRRLLGNLATVATLAGRIAHDDLGDAFTGRAYLTTGLDAAKEADDHSAAATALGHLAELAHTDHRHSAATEYLTAAREHLDRAPQLAGWLAGIAALLHADHGDHQAANQAATQAATAPRPADRTAAQRCDARMAAVRGHLALKAADHDTARQGLTDALDLLPRTARRLRMRVLLDLADLELTAGNLAEACRHASTVAEYLHAAGNATVAAQLRAFRARIASQKVERRILRIIDAYLRPAA
jgi:transcriptional regulator with XRE-family HTH domain